MNRLPAKRFATVTLLKFQMMPIDNLEDLAEFDRTSSGFELSFLNLKYSSKGKALPKKIWIHRCDCVTLSASEVPVILHEELVRFSVFGRLEFRKEFSGFVTAKQS